MLCKQIQSLRVSCTTHYLYQRQCAHARQKPGVGQLVIHTLLARMEHPHAGMGGSACSATPQRCAEDEQEPARASLIGVRGVIAGKFTVSSNCFVISMLQGEILWKSAPLRCRRNEGGQKPYAMRADTPLIFQELESRSCRDHKVMILATSTTVKKLPITPATPY